MPLLLQDPDIAIRPVVSRDANSLLTAMLRASDQGVMLTDLEHQTIACNSRFGEIFGVDIQEVVHSDALEVRQMVAHLIPDMAEWERNLDLVYRDPYHTQEDELELLGEPPRTIRRFTGPVTDMDGKLVGRLWTFLDTSKESRSRRMRDVLYTVSTFHRSDPSEVYSKVVDEVAQFFGSNAVLSLLKEDFLEFRAVSSPIEALRELRGNDLTSSYCQFALSTNEPFQVQNASLDPLMCTVLPARHGFTRYLGVPLSSPEGDLIGTLCILDGKSTELLGDEDTQFMSMMAMRVSAELAREAHISERIAEKESALDAQRRTLKETREVLQAVNKGFELLGAQASVDGLIREQVRLLCGVLGYHGIALVQESGDHKFSGYAMRVGDPNPARCEAAGNTALGKLVSADRLVLVPLKKLETSVGYLVLGSDQPLEDADEFHETLLEAMLDQVSLVVGTKVLQAELEGTHRELRDTQMQLVQSEKLSVVGTLAASTAHDIKNILSSITLELGFGVESPERALASVKSHLDRFSVLAHRLLSYAKPRMVAMQPVDLNDVVLKVLALTSAQTRIASVTVVWEPSRCLPPVLGDPHQLEHLFVNLVLNAVQAMNTGGGTLVVKAKDTKSGVEIEVTDSGKGIRKELVDKLFEPFTSDRNEGFGLGLFSCRRIVEGHGGKIGVRSTLGQGTTFKVTLRQASA
ncbi:MAG: GAF domain-containing protein [Armatimonadetes bacterium]|nr:GAF domain-containing protein [Armatimonadota bacterium]